MVSVVYLHEDTPIDSDFHKADDSDMVVQSGADWMDINATLKDKGIPLFFPVSDIVSLRISTAKCKRRLILAPLQL